VAKRTLICISLFLVFVLGFCPSLHAMEEACKSEKVGKTAALTADEAWTAANTRAKKWQADAVPFEIGTLSTGPLQSDGRSTEWSIKFSSESGNAVNLIGISNGTISCWSHTGAGGRVIAFSDKIILDSKRLYDLAQKSGGEKYTSQGFKPSAGLVQNPKAGPLWYINYDAPEGKEGSLSVVIDALTGEVTNVFER
jgi:hypothetical protein